MSVGAKAGDPAGAPQHPQPTGTDAEMTERSLSGWIQSRVEGRAGAAEAVLLVLSGLLAWAFRFIQDDAFITYRYARNLARGNGLVFNVGERVEGYTNFAWTAIHAIPEWLGWSSPVFSQLLGIAMLLVAVHLVVVISRRVFGSDGFALLVAVVTVANMTFLVYATGGLETMMQTMLVLGVTAAVIDALVDRSEVGTARLLVAGALAGVAILTRLDSVVYLVGLYGAVLVRQYKGRGSSTVLVRTVLVSAVPAVLAVGPWLVWKMAYYGELLPNTYFAKSASGLLQPVLYGLVYVVAYFVSYGAFLLIGRYRRHRSSFFAVPGASALLAVVPLWLAYVVYVGADFMEYRFMVIITPVMAMLAAWLIDRFVNPRTEMLLVGVLVAFSLTHQFAAPPIAFPVLSFEQIHHWPSESPTTWMHLGNLLAENFPGGPGVEGQPVIAVAPLGVISYLSDLETVDMLGLTDAHVARHGDEAQMYYPGHVKMADPDYLRERGVDLIIGQPGPLSNPQRFEGYRLSQLVEVYPVTDLRELPTDAVVLELPATTTEAGVDIVWPTIYLGGNALVDRAIERNGWTVKPIIRECDPGDLDVWLTRLLASRTCPDL